MLNYADPGSYIINFSSRSCGPVWAELCDF